MFICEGKVVGMLDYEKDGEKKSYAQVNYVSKIKGYSGLRSVACRCSYGKYKIGDKIEVVDDFRYPQILEK